MQSWTSFSKKLTSGRTLFVSLRSSGQLAAYRITDSGELEFIDRMESGPVSWAIIAVESQP